MAIGADLVLPPSFFESAGARRFYGEDYFPMRGLVLTAMTHVAFYASAAALQTCASLVNRVVNRADQAGVSWENAITDVKIVQSMLKILTTYLFNSRWAMVGLLLPAFIQHADSLEGDAYIDFLQSNQPTLHFLGLLRVMGAERHYHVQDAKEDIDQLIADRARAVVDPVERASLYAAMMMDGRVQFGVNESITRFEVLFVEEGVGLVEAALNLEDPEESKNLLGLALRKYLLTEESQAFPADLQEALEELKERIGPEEFIAFTKQVSSGITRERLGSTPHANHDNFVAFREAFDFEAVLGEVQQGFFADLFQLRDLEAELQAEFGVFDTTRKTHGIALGDTERLEEAPSTLRTDHVRAPLTNVREPAMLPLRTLRLMIGKSPRERHSLVYEALKGERIQPFSLIMNGGTPETSVTMTGTSQEIASAFLEHDRLGMFSDEFIANAIRLAQERAYDQVADAVMRDYQRSPATGARSVVVGTTSYGADMPEVATAQVWMDRTSAGIEEHDTTTMRAMFDHIQGEIDRLLPSISDHERYELALTLFLECSQTAMIDVINIGMVERGNYLKYALSAQKGALVHIDSSSRQVMSAIHLDIEGDDPKLIVRSRATYDTVLRSSAGNAMVQDHEILARRENGLEVVDVLEVKIDGPVEALRATSKHRLIVH